MKTLKTVVLFTTDLGCFQIMFRGRGMGNRSERALARLLCTKSMKLK